MSTSRWGYATRRNYVTSGNEPVSRRSRVGGLGDLGDYADFDDLWFSFEQGVGRSGAVYLRLDPVRREALRSRAHKLQGAPRGRFRLAEVG